nr:substrate-binding domain-containing protein [Alphaproteobacteria bacterium]
ILPKFTAVSGIKVQVVAVGTGQALKNARNGDGDVLLVHAKPAEEEFVADGWGVKRHDVMYNDFVLVGPHVDPAGIADSKSVTEALKRIQSAKAPFLSRGDDSGTHKAEKRLWAAANIDPGPASGTWYREAGSGMGATINTAIGMNAYVLTDRATWISFHNKSHHKLLFEGDPKLFNQYGIIQVNPERHARVNATGGAKLIDWILSKDGQAAIAAFRVRGQQLFYPNAKP